MIFLYFCLVLLKSLSQMAFYFSNLILQTAYQKSPPIYNWRALEINANQKRCDLHYPVVQRY
ncbi:hypothetical protein E5340_09060 [Ligilactobacillus murinus]|uniref:Uncharacterized protein n=1 Tax=Ligilactobacillus murinus TaxID=1622 RepID=A0A4S2EDV1_9LACO|nr:hypothetical protein E5340_09060 [Ligilactobacillus murinus]